MTTPVSVVAPATPIRVLILEDRPADAELMTIELRQGGFVPTCTRVDTEVGYVEALGPDLDLILADYTLPQFTAPLALDLLVARGLDIPFIVVTGTVGEEAAVECLKKGAADYLLKDRLARLGSAVAHALAERALRVEKRRTDETLREETRKLHSILDSMAEGVVVADVNGRLVEFNPAAERLHGLGRTDEPPEGWGTRYGIFLEDGVTPCPPAEIPLRRTIHGETTDSVRLYVKRPDGTGSPVEVNGRPILDAAGAVVGGVAVFADVTERRRAEQEILRLNRVRTLFVRVSQAIVRATSPQQLFEEACRIAVEDLSFRMACVGLTDDTTHVVQPVAMSGHVDGYLDQVRISIDDIPEGRGPTGTAIREGRPVICRDIDHDPIMTPWREAALARGYRSSAALPLRVMGAVTGAYAIYSSEVGWFGVKELRLLDALASDISFALDALERGRQREQAESALRESARELEEAQRVAGVGSWDWTLKTGVITWSDELYRINRFDPTLPVPSFENLGQFYTPESWTRLRAVVESALQKGTPYELDLQQIRTDGASIWTTIRGEAVRDANGQIVRLRGTVLDITDRQRAQDQVAAQVRQLEAVMLGTVRAVSATVDMRDPYTAGHERRVGNLARAIGAELGLSENRLQGLEMISHVHDMGKVAVPAEILSKPGKLTAIEFALVKTHAQSGHDMMRDVEFPWPLGETILQHHERLDGSGYPRGHKGEEIILEARILAVADVIEAMASHRPYRPSLGIDAALEEIATGSGRLYDPQVAAACLRLFREKGYVLPAADARSTQVPQ